MKSTSSTEKKPGLFQRTKLFFSQVKTETEKVTWPSKEQVKTYTIVVLTASIIVAILMGLWDLVVTEVIKVIFEVAS
jgi:preprotein translocase subunit SecE